MRGGEHLPAPARGEQMQRVEVAAALYTHTQTHTHTNVGPGGGAAREKERVAELAQMRVSHGLSTYLREIGANAHGMHTVSCIQPILSQGRNEIHNICTHIKYKKKSVGM